MQNVDVKANAAAVGRAKRLTILRLACAAMVFTCALSQAQIAPTRPQFEVASVKPVADDDTPQAAFLQQLARSSRHPGEIPMAGADRVRLKHWALVDLIAAAYRVRPAQVSGAAWISDAAFDIEATVPDGTAPEQLNGMLQSLLEDRFGLKVHRATQFAEGYALLVGKDGSKLKAAAAPTTASDQQLTIEERKAQLEQKMQDNMAAMKKQMVERAANVGPAFSTESFSSITMEDLAANLVRPAGAPVVDATGLTGKYAVTIETWKNPDIPGGTIFDAVDKLGLKLEPRKLSVETVVVDQVSKMPTAN